MLSDGRNIYALFAHVRFRCQQKLSHGHLKYTIWFPIIQKPPSCN